MKFPQFTAIKIELDGRQFVSANYSSDLRHGLQVEIQIKGTRSGSLQVYCTENKPFLLPEEQNANFIFKEDTWKIQSTKIINLCLDSKTTPLFADYRSYLNG